MIAFGYVRGEAFENKLADEVCCGICADVDQAIDENKRSTAIGFRVVEVGDGCSGEATQDMGRTP